MALVSCEDPFDRCVDGRWEGKAFKCWVYSTSQVDRILRKYRDNGKEKGNYFLASWCLLFRVYSLPQVDRLRGIWGSNCNIPKAIFDLLKGE